MSVARFSTIVVKTSGAEVVFAVHTTREEAERVAQQLRRFSSAAKAYVRRGWWGEPGETLGRAKRSRRSAP